MKTLFQAQWVRVKLGPEEFPGYKGERAICAECGEGINFKREVVRDAARALQILRGRALLRTAL